MDPIALNLTLDRAIEPGEVIRFVDVVTNFCTFYDSTLATCSILVLAMYIFKEYVFKIGLKAWEHPNYPFKFIIPLDVRNGILKLLGVIGHIIEGCGAMAAGYLVYFVYIEGFFTLKHWVIIGVLLFFMAVIIVTAGIQYVQERKK